MTSSGERCPDTSKEAAVRMLRGRNIETWETFTAKTYILSLGSYSVQQAFCASWWSLKLGHRNLKQGLMHLTLFVIPGLKFLEHHFPHL